jgi:hypothetical protein
VAKRGGAARSRALREDATRCVARRGDAERSDAPWCRLAPQTVRRPGGRRCQPPKELAVASSCGAERRVAMRSGA